jgi:mannose-1-phosphate guanylyltransferase
MLDAPVHALLLAAGLGTRLGELSAERPKPMLPVCNRPLVRWAAQLCVEHGLRELSVNLHHLGEQIRAELGDGTDLGATVLYSPEPEILGTGGGIKAMAAMRPRGTVLVMNAKLVVDIDLRELLAFHRERRALATLVLREDRTPERWGALGLDERGDLTRLLEERRPGVGATRDLMFTGIHVLEPAAVEAIPDGPCCVIRTAYAALFRSGAPLVGFVLRGTFQEHSTPRRYLDGNLELLRGVGVPRVCPGPLRGVDPAAQVESTARLVEPLLVGPRATIGAGATVGPEVVLGAGARVADGVQVSRSVVWPDAVVRASVTHAVVTPRTCLQLDGRHAEER